MHTVPTVKPFKKNCSLFIRTTHVREQNLFASDFVHKPRIVRLFVENFRKQNLFANVITVYKPVRKETIANRHEPFVDITSNINKK